MAQRAQGLPERAHSDEHVYEHLGSINAAIRA